MGVKYDSLALALFCCMHFINDKIGLYLYYIAEHAVQRKFEFVCDLFSKENGGEGSGREIKESLLIVFYKNKLDYYTDDLYSAVKNSHPTLAERIKALE